MVLPSLNCIQPIAGSLGALLYIDMRCPVCDHPEDRVLDSRPLESVTVIRRRRLCLHCGKRFTTYERVEATPLMVIKSDNRREPFSRNKLREGVARACQKRPISSDTIEKLVSEVEYELQDYVLEVPTREIGERVLKKLHRLDPVAYVRFASVYRQFADLDMFLKELQKLKKAHQRDEARKLQERKAGQKEAKELSSAAHRR